MLVPNSTLEGNVATARNQKNVIKLHNKSIAVYASPKIAHALKDIVGEMPLYEGVKMIQLLEAVYDQGHKDGARKAFEVITGKVKEAEKAIPHRNPGKPPKKN